ncbi:MAG: CoA transferase [Gammaproteobacteria bacterium]|nr:CoA transferase [Gammaproteobacteria bacterium]
MPMPLDGLRVIELNRVAPGSYCTMMLADMGAEVIRVETPSGAGGAKDNAVADDDIWVKSEYTNRNKQSITLNLKHPDAQAVLHDLARTADVVVEGFRPGVTARLGCDYATLSALNPRLVYCSLSGFGQDGPYAARAGHDLNYLALAGALGQIGHREGPPVIPLNIIGDYAGATLHGVVGILLALLARHASGAGQHVDVSYLDASFALLAAVPGIRNFFVGGPEPQRGDNVFAGEQPYYTVYETADGRWLTVGCMEPWLWNNFCAAIGRPELEAACMQRDDFQAAASTAQREYHAEVAAIIRTRPLAEWVSHFATADVCVAEVNTLAEALADPQLRHRDMVVAVDDPALPGAVQPGIPIKLSATPGAIRSPARRAGADNEAVLAALGRTPEQIAALRAGGAI